MNENVAQVLDEEQVKIAMRDLRGLIARHCPVLNGDPVLVDALIDRAQQQLEDGITLRSFTLITVFSEAAKMERHMQNLLSLDDVLPRGTGATVKRLMRYSWEDIDYRYDDMTESEKSMVTPEQFDKLMRWVRD